MPSSLKKLQNTPDNPTYNVLYGQMLQKSFKSEIGGCDYSVWWPEHSLRHTLVNLLTLSTQSLVGKIDQNSGEIAEYDGVYNYKPNEMNSPIIKTPYGSGNIYLANGAYKRDSTYIKENWDPIENIQAPKIAVIPYNFGNNHWEMTLIIDNEKIHLNSFYENPLYQKYNQLRKAGFDIIPTGLQDNGYSCGDYTILFAYLAANFPDVFKNAAKNTDEIKQLTQAYIEKVGGLKALRLIFMFCSITPYHMTLINEHYKGLLQEIWDKESGCIEAIDSNVATLLSNLGITPNKPTFELNQLNEEALGFEFVAPEESEGFEFVSPEGSEQGGEFASHSLDDVMTIIKELINTPPLCNIKTSSSDYWSKNSIEQIIDTFQKAAEHNGTVGDIWSNIRSIANNHQNGKEIEKKFLDTLKQIEPYIHDDNTVDKKALQILADFCKSTNCNSKSLDSYLNIHIQPNKI